MQRSIKSLVTALLLLFSATVSSNAQFESLSGISGTMLDFSFPEIVDGEYKWWIHGAEAKFSTNNLVRIKEMRFEWMKLEKPDVVLTTPECEVNMDQKTAISDQPVHVVFTSRRMDIRGVGMKMDYLKSEMSIESQVEVELVIPRKNRIDLPL